MHDRAELWEMLKQALANERATLQMQINFNTQQKYGITPFPDATHLPADLNADSSGHPPMHRRMMPSEMINSGTARFMREYQERLQAMRSGPMEEVKD
jgi:hypothetical protein